MVVVFLVPVLVGIGVGALRAARASTSTAVLTVVPFVDHPGRASGTAVTLLLVNVFPARRARDILMLMGLLFAAGLVMLLRFIQPGAAAARRVAARHHRFLRDAAVAGHAAAAVVLGRARRCSPACRAALDCCTSAALWTTALGARWCWSAPANERWHFAGYSRRRKRARRASRSFAVARRASSRALPLSAVRRQLLVKDLKVFLRDVSQWSQLLLLLALVLLYLYNFRVLDLDRIPYMSGVIKNVYAFVNLAMAGFVMATVAVRFVFPAVSAEGAAFWIIRTSPDLAARLPVVEVLDRARAGAGADRGADGHRQRVPGRRPVPEGGGRGRPSSS